jgi:hypothetical protein
VLNVLGEIAIAAAAIACIITAILLIGYLIRTVQSEQQRTQPQRGRTQRQQRPTSSPKANPQLQSQLLNMVGGNREIAHRLVNFARANKPGQSENWYLEKAIEDLVRDRR